MRCCLACLLKVLSDMLQSPQPLSHIHICPKPKVKLGPTETFYPAPPNSLDIAIARNPNQFGLTNGISVSPRWDCKLSTAIISVSPRYAIGLTEFAWPTLCFTYYPNRSHRVCVIGQTELRLYPNPSTPILPS